MINDLVLGSLPLDKGRIRHVRRGLGRRVECLSGVLWITQDGDLRDIVLEPGEAFAFDQPGDAWISALADSRFLLLETRVPAAAH
ncbi:MAG: DUF2917 domain-containing protein [Caldimonas sp.]